MKYRFDNFNAELTDPTIESVSTSFVLGDDYVAIHAVLNANDNRLFGVHLGQMENSDNWGDAEVMDFAIKQLETFKV